MPSGESSSGDAPGSPSAIPPDARVVADQLWSMPVPFMLSVRATGEILAVNAGFEHVTGFAARDLVGRTTLDIGLFASRADREAVIGPLAVTRSIDQCETQLRTRAGGVRTMLISCRRFQDRGRDLLCSLFMDVTALKQVELGLKESEERYRRLFHEGIDAAVVLAWEPGPALGRPVEVNDRMAELLERSRDELMGLRPADWEAPENTMPIDALAAEIDRLGQVTAERIARTPSGRRIIVEVRSRMFDWKGRPHVLASVRDLTPQRAAEEALRLNETSLRVALTAANIGLFRTDRDLRVNWSFSPARGGSVNFEDADGQVRPGITNPRSRLGRALRAVVATGRGERIDVHLQRAGRVCMHEIVIEPVRDRAGTVIGVTAAVLDVEQRKAAERELRAAARRFELLSEAAPTGIFETDANGWVTHANAAARRIIGRTLREPVPVQSLALPEDHWRTKLRWESLRRGEVAGQKEIRITRPDGEIRWVLVQLNPVMSDGALQQVVGSVADVTDEHYLTGLLRALVDARSAHGSFFPEALARIATLLGAVFGCILLRDAPRGRLRPAVCWREGRVLDDTAAERDCPGEELISGECRIVSVGLAKAAPRLAAEWAQGCEAALCQPLPRREGGTAGYLCLVWPRQLRETVPLRRLAEIAALSLAAEIERGDEVRAKRQVEQQLLQSQKFEALGALATGIAHDFNNVLTAVMNFAELARAANATPERDHYLDQIVAAGRRASGLARQILKFRRRPLGGADEETVPLDVRHLVSDALRFLRPAIYSSIRVDYSAGERTPLVRGDATRMYQVVMNLFINAAQAIGDRVGRIRVAVDLVEPDPVAGSVPGRQVRIVVEDTGPGIPPEIRDRVFEPCFTTKERAGGSGLGLALVRQIVEEHGGTVEIDADVKSGARFVVRLPACEDAPVPAELPMASAAPAGSGEHILVVDDDLAVLHACESALLQHGYRVSAFTEPGKALASFWADPTQFDAAVIDFRMPGMTGVALTEQLQRVGTHVPVALITGAAATVTLSQARACGATELLEKPFGPYELARIVARLLAARGD